MAPPRNRTFDLMRLLFASLVLLSHAPELMDGNRSRELLARATQGGLSFGEFGVDGFFLLSGFLITQSWMRDPKLSDFLMKRVLRIVPGYLVAVLLSIVVLGLLAPGVPHFFHVPGWKALASVLFLSSPITSPVLPGNAYQQVNGALWTIAYEFRCYLLIAAAGLTGLLRSRRSFLALTILLIALAHAHALTMHLEWDYGWVFGDTLPTFRLVPFFAVGACFYLFRDRVVYHWVLLGAVLAGIVAMQVFAPKHSELSMAIFGSYVLFFVAHLRFERLNRLRMPDISYGLYLYGFPIESLWVYFLHGSPWVMFAGSLPIALGLGWLSWHFVERPMLKLKRHPTAALPAA